MTTTLSCFYGHGRAGAHLEMTRGVPPRAGRSLGMIVVALVLPITLVLVVQAAGSITGWYHIDTLLNAPGAPWVYVLTAATLGCLLALVILIAARLRFSATHAGGDWRVALVIRLTALEAVAFAVAAVLVGLLAVHLLADGFACANGVLRAC